MEIRYQRAARAREQCLLRLREHLDYLPPPVIAAVHDLVDALLRLGQTPDDAIEDTVVGRR